MAANAQLEIDQMSSKNVVFEEIFGGDEMESVDMELVFQEINRRIVSADAKGKKIRLVMYIVD